MKVIQGKTSDGYKKKVSEASWIENKTHKKHISTVESS